MKNKQTVRIISGVLAFIGFVAPFVADMLEGELMEQEIEEKVNEVLKKKGVVKKDED